MRDAGLYLADSANRRIRVVQPAAAPVIALSTTSVSFNLTATGCQLFSGAVSRFSFRCRFVYERVHMTKTFLILCLLFAAAGALNAQLDVAMMFSTSIGNPNAFWTYAAGATALPLTANWNGNGTLGCTVPAWAPSNSAGNFAPAFFQANSCVSSFFGADPTPGSGSPNVTAGSIVVRTSDSSSVHASLLLTVSGSLDPLLSMLVWNARVGSQPQDWVLLRNGVQVASGVLGGSVGRGAAEGYVDSGAVLTDTVELDIFKDPGSSSGDFVGVSLSSWYNTNWTVSTAEIDAYNTTNVTQQANTYKVELKARMLGGAYLYDQTFNVPYTDPSIQTAITQAKSVLTQAGALYFAGPTQLSSTQSTSAATNTVQTGQATQAYVGVLERVGPQVVAIGSLGICQTASVPPASTSTSFYPVLTGCTGGEQVSLPPGVIDFHALTSSFVTIAQTVTTTNTTLTSQVYELDGSPTPISVPTLSQWALFLLAGLLAVAGAFLLRRGIRRRAV